SRIDADPMPHTLEDRGADPHFGDPDPCRERARRLVGRWMDAGVTQTDGSRTSSPRAAPRRVRPPKVKKRGAAIADTVGVASPPPVGRGVAIRAKTKVVGAKRCEAVVRTLPAAIHVRLIDVTPVRKRWIEPVGLRAALMIHPESMDDLVHLLDRR